MIINKERKKRKVSGVEIGSRFETRKCGWCTVISYSSSTDIQIVFDETPNYSSTAVASRLRDGGVNNPYKPVVSGVGFIGVGKYVAAINGKTTPEYNAWNGAMERCYSEKYLLKNTRYKDCTVHPDWHNFQVFAEWYTKHESYRLGYHLDKDAMVKGNKVYGADTCCLLPNELNSVIRLWESKSSGFFGHGVRYTYNNKFKVRATTVSGRKNLGVYNSQEEAMKVFTEAKERYVKNLALKWANRIEWRAFVALMNWTVYPKEQAT